MHLNSAGVDGRLSGGSSVRRPGSEDPIGASGIIEYEQAKEVKQESIL